MKTLTQKEQAFLKAWLLEASSQCGADTPKELIDDNFSCINTEDGITGYNKHQLCGFIGSLNAKGVSYTEDRKGDCDLYWISTEFLETLPSGTKFEDIDYSKVQVG